MHSTVHEKDIVVPHMTKCGSVELLVLSSRLFNEKDYFTKFPSCKIY